MILNKRKRHILLAIQILLLETFFRLSIFDDLPFISFSYIIPTGFFIVVIFIFRGLKPTATNITSLRDFDVYSIS